MGIKSTRLIDFLKKKGGLASYAEIIDILLTGKTQNRSKDVFKSI